jgi:hypothetical protein
VKRQVKLNQEFTILLFILPILIYFLILEKFNFKGGTQHLYPFIESDPTGPKRTNESYFYDLSKLKKSTEPVRGVKGPCSFTILRHFNPVSSICIDFMHSMLEGVKKLFSFWFDPNHSKGGYSLRSMQREIEKRLSVISPPKFVPSTPRTIYSHNLWRAHENLSFILYYALPVFRDLMPMTFYENLKKLVLFVETLLAAEITIDRLNKVHNLVIEFVKEASRLYPPSIMLSGMHELMHLVECTLDFGPLNTTNCFQFEELNRKLMRFLHGHDLIGEEIIKIASTAQMLSSYARNVKNNKIKEYISSRVSFKSSNIKKLSNTKVEIVVIDKVKQTMEPTLLQVYEKFSKQKIRSS